MNSHSMLVCTIYIGFMPLWMNRLQSNIDWVYVLCMSRLQSYNQDMVMVTPMVTNIDNGRTVYIAVKCRSTRCKLQGFCQENWRCSAPLTEAADALLSLDMPSLGIVEDI